jgi:hypothetical protein
MKMKDWKVKQVLFGAENQWEEGRVNRKGDGK